MSLGSIGCGTKVRNRIIAFKGATMNEYTECSNIRPNPAPDIITCIKKFLETYEITINCSYLIISLLTRYMMILMLNMLKI